MALLFNDFPQMGVFYQRSLHGKTPDLTIASQTAWMSGNSPCTPTAYLRPSRMMVRISYRNKPEPSPFKYGLYAGPMIKMWLAPSSIKTFMPAAGPSISSASMIHAPVEPNPPWPRAVTDKSATSLNSTRWIGSTMAWAMRSPGLISSGGLSYGRSSQVSLTLTLPR